MAQVVSSSSFSSSCSSASISVEQKAASVRERNLVQW